MYWLVFPVLRWSSLSSVWLVGGEQSLERCVFAARIVGWWPTQSAVTTAPCPAIPLLLALQWRQPRCSYEFCPFCYTLIFHYWLLISWKTKWVCCVEQATLADFAPVTSPQIPALVIYCIKEIEKRGLHEVRWRCLSHTCPPFPSVSHIRSSFLDHSTLAQVGLYRISGHERLVKELKEKLVRGKTLPSLAKIEDINVITGVLKDFFRKLPEPLLTFQLNKAFIEAAGEA